MASNEASPPLNQLTLEAFGIHPHTHTPPEGETGKKVIIIHTFGIGNSCAIDRAEALGLDLVNLPLFNCLRLPNPYPKLSLSASDREILDYFKHNTRFTRLVTEASEHARKYRSMACYCIGGHHRSIAVALALKERLKKGWDVRIIRHK